MRDGEGANSCWWQLNFPDFWRCVAAEKWSDSLYPCSVWANIVSAGPGHKRAPRTLIAEEWATLNFHGKVHFDNYANSLSGRRARFLIKFITLHQHLRTARRPTAEIWRYIQKWWQCFVEIAKATYLDTCTACCCHQSKLYSWAVLRCRVISILNFVACVCNFKCYPLGYWMRFWIDRPGR